MSPYRDPTTLPDGWPVVSNTQMIVFGICTVLLWLLILTSRHSSVFLLSYVNLAIHEGGHIVCRPFGLTIHVWGGTLFQCLMPLAIGVHFWRRRQTAGTAVMGLWLGQNLLEVSVYAADAKARVLPLLFGKGSIHDWHYIFNKLGCLSSCTTIATGIKVAGWLIMFAAAGWYIWRWRMSVEHAQRQANSQ